MARIRSVKPEFWTSEQIAECSPNARLLFIGLWNFCDDYGVHQASEVRLKMEVFPSDSFSKEDVRRMMDELIANGLVEEYEIDGLRYWFVTGWDKHQKPDTKTGKYPRPDGSIGTKIRRKDSEDSPNDNRMNGERSPTEKEKEKEKEKESIEAKQRRGSRLPADWKPSDVDKQFCKTERPDLDPEKTADRFRDYWVSQPGSKGVKLNWSATWRNWVRNETRYASAQPQPRDQFAGSI